MAYVPMVALASVSALVLGIGCAAPPPAFPDASGTGDSTSVPLSTSTGDAADESSSTSQASSTTGTTTAAYDTSTTWLDSTTDRVPVCQSALLVTGDPDPTTSVDAPYYTRMLELGYAVEVVDNAASQTADLEGHCLVLVSPIGLAAEVGATFRDVPIPVLTWEYNLFAYMMMVSGAAAAGSVMNQDLIEIVDPSHPLAAGMNGVVAIFAGGGTIGWAIPAGDAIVVARLRDDEIRATLFAFEQGAIMANGFVAPARRVAVAGGQTTTPVTPAALDLFEAAVDWATEQQ